MQLEQEAELFLMAWMLVDGASYLERVTEGSITCRIGQVGEALLSFSCSSSVAGVDSGRGECSHC